MSGYHTHVIPVPWGMSVEDAWMEITTLGRLFEDPEGEPRWGTVMCDGQECGSVIRG